MKTFLISTLLLLISIWLITVSTIHLLSRGHKLPVEVDTTGWIAEHSEIPQMPESDRQFKLSLLRIDRDYYFQADCMCFETASNLLQMGDEKMAKHWRCEMMKYQMLYKQVSDSIKMYHHNQIAQ